MRSCRPFFNPLFVSLSLNLRPNFINSNSISFSIFEFFSSSSCFFKPRYFQTRHQFENYSLRRFFFFQKLEFLVKFFFTCLYHSKSKAVKLHQKIYTFVTKSIKLIIFNFINYLLPQHLNRYLRLFLSR